VGRWFKLSCLFVCHEVLQDRLMSVVERNRKEPLRGWIGRQSERKQATPCKRS
jgi:hypothetical protein